MKVTDWLWMIILSVIWGSSFMFLKIALRELTPFWLIFFRLAFAVPFMVLVCRFMRLSFPRDLRSWLSIGFLGIINTGLPFYMISWAQQFVDSSTASILNATSPVFVMILAHFLTDDEKLTWRKVTGVLTGIAGIVAMVWSSLASGIVLAGMAQLAILGGTFNYALAGIYARRFRHLPSVMVTAVSLIGALVFLLPGLLFAEPPAFMALKPLTWLALTMLGIFCTGVAYIIYFRIIATAGATNALLVTLMIPVSALLLASTVLGETLKPNDILGMLLIFSGLLIIDGRLVDLITRPRKPAN
ncbi:MAG TPA: DMT family transporter [Candidatus Ozemobacteraceae bacterium]|nr:DMT family transporter [Candidatus Ozemobacteraceae bacterium]